MIFITMPRDKIILWMIVMRAWLMTSIQDSFRWFSMNIDEDTDFMLDEFVPRSPSVGGKQVVA
jgi:hypothetical protein